MASDSSSRCDRACDTAATASIGTPPATSSGRSTTTRTTLRRPAACTATSSTTSPAPDATSSARPRTASTAAIPPPSSACVPAGARRRHDLSAYCGAATASAFRWPGAQRAIIRGVVSEHGGRHEGHVLEATSEARLPVPRRTVLAGVAGMAGVLLAGGLAGCSTDPPASASTPSSTPTRSADDLALARARGAALELAGLAQALAAARPDLDGLLQDVVADHRAHLVAVGAPSAAPPPRPPPSKGPADAADGPALGGAATPPAPTPPDRRPPVGPGG